MCRSSATGSPASAARSSASQRAASTGSSQDGTSPSASRPHRLAARSASLSGQPTATPEFSVSTGPAVHRVHGGNAALVVHHILDTFFAKKDGKPLPPKPTLVPNLNPSMG